MANIMMTAETPMMIPSMVSAERVLFAISALKDIRVVSAMEIMRALSFYR